MRDSGMANAWLPLVKSPRDFYTYLRMKVMVFERRYTILKMKPLPKEGVAFEDDLSWKSHLKKWQGSGYGEKQIMQHYSSGD